MKSYKEIEIGIKQRFKIGIVMCNFTLCLIMIASFRHKALQQFLEKGVSIAGASIER